MKQNAWLLIPVLSTSLMMMAGCASSDSTHTGRMSLVEVASGDRQWTGIAIAPDGRIFVNYPRWSDNVPFSVGELRPGGAVSPYPDEELNRWTPGSDPAEHLVCVQSVMVDRSGYLWILDAANPQFKGVVDGGAKLLKIDLASNRIVKSIRFMPPVIKPESYLNDVCVDTKRQVAYLTDSGAGGLIVADLTTGASRRVLARHPSTLSEGAVLTIGGHPWLSPDGSVPKVHADGIAMDPGGDILYYQALTGRTLHRIETRWLRDSKLTEDELGEKVEILGRTGSADGLLFGPDGRIYISALEENAIKAFSPGGKTEIVVQSPQLAWPDSFAIGPDGAIYVTCSQIHLGQNPPSPYKIFKLERTH